MHHRLQVFAGQGLSSQPFSMEINTATPLYVPSELALAGLQQE